MSEQKVLRIHTNDRGYVLQIRGTLRDNGEFSFGPLEANEMLVKLAEALLDRHVEVIEK